jgi:hypothetical protein
VLLGWGLDAVLYRLVECKHNPPHGTKRTPMVPDDRCPNDKPPRDDATVYPPGGVGGGSGKLAGGQPGFSFLVTRGG